MRILNISTDYSFDSGTLYSDLNNALIEAGHSVVVLYADPNLASENTKKIKAPNGLELFPIKSKKIEKVSYIKKGIAFLEFPILLKKNIKKYLSQEKFDLILFYAPPVTLVSVVRWAKKFFGCRAFLMQKDIFPQNAVDLEVFTKKSIVYKYFRHKEIAMLKVSDWIGCMSEANIDYIRKHNTYLDKKKVIYFPNTKKIEPLKEFTNREELRQKYSIPSNACVFIYGGNMGQPQYLELLCRAIINFKNSKNIFFLCIGDGTCAFKIKDALKANKVENAIYKKSLPNKEYLELLSCVDVGLVTLDPRYTIPNYPSKTLAYMDIAKPIIAATDLNTDYKQLIESQAKCGLWCDSANDVDFFEHIKKLASDEDLRQTLGNNARKYLEENFDVEKSVKILTDVFYT